MPWTQLANTKLSLSTFWTTGTVFSSVSLPLSGGAFSGNNIPNSAIDAWVSGDLDRLRNQFVVPCGGGHADWWGNQVLAYVPTSSWKLLRTASSGFGASNSTQADSPRNPDGSPASKHTYDAVCYMDSVDKFWCASGIYYFTGNSSPLVTWWWDPVTRAYTEKAVRPTGYASSAVWDPVTNLLYLRTSTGFYSYNPLVELSAPNAAAYTLLFSQSGGMTAGSPLVLDSVGRKIYRIDRVTPTGGTCLRVIDLNNLQAKEKTIPTTGDTDVETGIPATSILTGGPAYAPGLIFADNRLIALGPSTTYSTAIGSVHGEWAVYTLIPPATPSTSVTIAWLRDTSAPGAQPPYVSTSSGWYSHGVYKKFFRSSTGGYFVFHQMDGNVWQYTPSWNPTGLILDQVTDLNITVSTS